MKKTLLLACMIMLMPAMAFGQAEWSALGGFWPDPLTADAIGSGHGVAVDGDGRIWFQPFSASDSVQVAELGDTYQPVRVIYVFEEDGTFVEKVKFVDLPGGAADTLGGYASRNAAGEQIWEGVSGRGLRADYNGNIFVSGFNRLYHLLYTSVGDGDERATAAVDKRVFGDYCALAAPAVDEAGNVYVAPVCPGPPIRRLNPDLSDAENVTDAAVGFSRSFEVSADGNQVYWAGYTNHAVVYYQKPDEFSPYDSMGVAIPGVDSESLTMNRTTGALWVGSGSANDTPNRYPDVTTNWIVDSWYAFNPADFTPDATDVPAASAFFTWQADGGEGRPRGLAFTADGQTAYVTQFSQAAPAMQRFTSTPTAIERLGDGVPDNFTLSQNYPNPFNPSTQIEFTLKESGYATLRVFDMLGREVDQLVQEDLPAGTYTTTFDAKDLASGTYLYVLQFGGQRLTGKMLLVK